MGSLKERIIKGVFWSLIGNAISKLLSFVALILVARIFGPEEYGVFEMLRNTLITFGVFTGMGIGLTATKYIATFYKKDHEKISHLMGTIYFITLVTTSIFALFLLIFAREVAQILLNNENLTFLLKLGVILLITNTFVALQNAIFAGFEKFKTITKINFIVGVINIPLMVFFAYKFGITGVIIALIISGIIQVSYGYYHIYKVQKEENINVNFRKIKEDLLFLWKFSIPTFIATAMVAPIVLVSKSILTYEENGYIAIGLFSAAYTIQSVLILFNMTLNNALIPILTSEGDNKNKTFKMINIYISWLVGLGITIPIIVFPEITKLMFGEKFFTQEYINTLIILMFSFIIYMFKQSISRSFIIDSKMWYSVLDNLVWGITLLIVTFFLSHIGSVGLALAYLISYIISLLVLVPILYKKNMLDKDLFLSKNAFFLWSLTFVLAFIAFSNLNFVYRLIIIFVSYFLLGVFVIKLKKSVKHVSSSYAE